MDIDVYPYPYVVPLSVRFLAELRCTDKGTPTVYYILYIINFLIIIRLPSIFLLFQISGNLPKYLVNLWLWEQFAWTDQNKKATVFAILSLGAHTTCQSLQSWQPATDPWFFSKYYKKRKIFQGLRRQVWKQWHQKKKSKIFCQPVRVRSKYLTILLF